MKTLLGPLPALMASWVRIPRVARCDVRRIHLRSRRGAREECTMRLGRFLVSIASKNPSSSSVVWCDEEMLGHPGSRMGCSAFGAAGGAGGGIDGGAR